MNAEFFAAVEDIEKEKGIPRGYMYEKIQQAMLAAFRKGQPRVRGKCGSHPRREQEAHRARDNKTVVNEVEGPDGGDRRGQRAPALQALQRWRHRRHPRGDEEIRPHRRPGSQAGHHPGHTRGGTRDDIRRVHQQGARDTDRRRFPHRPAHGRCVHQDQLQLRIYGRPAGPRRGRYAARSCTRATG